MTSPKGTFRQYKDLDLRILAVVRELESINDAAGELVWPESKCTMDRYLTIPGRSLRKARQMLMVMGVLARYVSEQPIPVPDDWNLLPVPGKVKGR